MARFPIYALHYVDGESDPDPLQPLVFPGGMLAAARWLMRHGSATDTLAVWRRVSIAPDRTVTIDLQLPPDWLLHRTPAGITESLRGWRPDRQTQLATPGAP